MSAAVSIRMYNTGFGDCFLLRFPGAEREGRILIDCGRHALSGPGPAMSRIVEQVIADIRDPDGRARVDLLVATHRHADHVNGFDAAEWSGVEVGEVWMPWTEDPVDAEARRICEAQSKRAVRLKRAAEQVRGAAEREYLLGFAGNNMTNEAAMKVLHEGFACRAPRRFLPEKEEPATRSIASLPGVTIRVLGPPRSEAAIRDMDPPKDEAFFTLFEQSLGIADAPPPVPFGPAHRMNREQFESKHAHLLASFTAETAARLASIEEAAMELMASLHKSINGTSLVLLIEVAGRKLLFPGDAQWGTWREMLERHRALLEGLDFLKVGHHGSHNATPREVLEGARALLGAGARAMIPVSRVEKWAEVIPRRGLLDSLEASGVVYARSDSGSGAAEFEVTLDGAQVLLVDTSFEAK